MSTIELTEQERAALAGMPEADRRVIAAFRQAMADHAVPAHPAGKCPATPCPCSASADAIEARVRELLDDPDAEPCIDCWVPLPLDATCYAVDGAIVCGPCAVRRYGNRADEYVIVKADAPGTCPNCGQPAASGFHAAENLNACPEWVTGEGWKDRPSGAQVSEGVSHRQIASVPAGRRSAQG